MPYKSEAQRKFFNSPAGEKKLGKEEVEKWNEESKGQNNLTEKVKDALGKAISACDSKKYVFRAKIDFAKYDMSESIKNQLERFTNSISVKWNKQDNSYIIDADAKNENDFLALAEWLEVFKFWIKK